ncbi:MAG: class I tRNA ligase family protein [Candidatus Delongbacteria bacterium]|nr:class I tRNA ligase family protein [Candidatus Delongbacteria bacterium]MCG2760509.1 class I tRNA ligase family protein [Candidatus Delongbacteria bacterium]
MGVDEHGLKVLSTAKEHGTTPEVYLDGLIPKWLDFCSKFRIDHDFFYRTSSKEHHSSAQRIWEICDGKGDIYKKHYEGLYCVGCEEFELHNAVYVINEMVSLGNQHIHEKEPWKQKPEDAEVTLNNVSYLLLVASELYEPVIPDGAQKAIEAIKSKEKVILFPRI